MQLTFVLIIIFREFCVLLSFILRFMSELVCNRVQFLLFLLIAFAFACASRDRVQLRWFEPELRLQQKQRMMKCFFILSQHLFQNMISYTR